MDMGVGRNGKWKEHGVGVGEGDEGRGKRGIAARGECWGKGGMGNGE